MIAYTRNDILKALDAVGVAAGDIVFFTSRMYTVGKLEGVKTSDEFCRVYLEAIFERIGNQGTLVVPAYSRQVGKYGVPYIHEETPTLSGLFNEYVRRQPGAVRSFHPVFSLAAIGRRAEEICGRVDTSGFGAGSAYGHLFRLDAKALCLGFEYESGHIVTGAHFVETTYGVPYYYNKILDAPVSRGGQASSKVFVLNVGYRKFGVEYDYRGYVEELDRRGMIRSAPLGDSTLYSSGMADQLRVGYEMLAENVYAFLKQPPAWVRGEIPFEGVESKLESPIPADVNWVGFNLRLGGR